MRNVTATTRRPTKFERRKVLIVREAVTVMNRAGVRGMTLAEVAGRLKLVPTAVSYYFPRKEQLAAACFLQAIERYEAFIADAAAESTTEASLRRLLTDFATFLAAVDRRETDAIAAFNDVRAINDPRVDAAYVELFRQFRRLFSADRVGPLERVERNARTHLLMAQVFWVALWLRHFDPSDYRRMIDRMLDILINGLAAPGVIWAPLELQGMTDGCEAAGISRESFLRAATEMINEHGYHGASVIRISARLNVTKGSFYHHNQTKDDLVAQCFDMTLRIMRRAQEHADLLSGTGFENLTSMAASLVCRDVAGEIPLLRTSALTAVPEALQTDVLRRFEHMTARIASGVSDGIADGSIRPVDANVAAQMITATINASAELKPWAPGVTPGEAAEVLARPLFMGLLSPGRLGRNKEI